MLNLKKLSWKALKAYLVFAVLHVSWKLFKTLKLAARVKRLWKHLPGQDLDLTGKKALKELYRLHDFLTEEGLKAPDAHLVKLPLPQPFLLCNSTESVKWILKDEFRFCTKNKYDTLIWEMMTYFLGPDGIFVLRHGEMLPKEHDLWHKQRKISSRIFTMSNFRGVFYDTFVEKGQNVLKRLGKDEGKVVDLQELFFSFTMDSIEKFFMGVEVNTVEGGMSEYAKAFDQTHNAMTTFFMNNVLLEPLCRFVLPFPFGTLNTEDAVLKTLVGRIIYQFHPKCRQFRDGLQKLDAHVLKYVRSTRIDPNLSERKDVIANFLNSDLRDSLTDTQLRDIVLNLTIAGRDTTACALSWLFFELTQNQEVQQKLQQEIDEKLQGRVPSMEDLKPESMPYLNGVLYEALRLHPPVPTDQKRVEKDLEFFDGTIIPKGTTMFFCPYKVGRDPKKYPNPMKFKPERWIPFKTPSLFEFPVFQAGPRFCLGKDMAQFEAKLLTAMILQKFSFEMDPEEAKFIDYTQMLTMSIANNEEKTSAKLLVTPRKR